MLCCFLYWKKCHSQDSLHIFIYFTGLSCMYINFEMQSTFVRLYYAWGCSFQMFSIRLWILIYMFKLLKAVTWNCLHRVFVLFFDMCFILLTLLYILFVVYGFGKDYFVNTDAVVIRCLFCSAIKYFSIIRLLHLYGVLKYEFNMYVLVVWLDVKQII